MSCPVYLSLETTRTKAIRLRQVWQPAPIDVDGEFIVTNPSSCANSTIAVDALIVRAVSR